MFRVKVFDKMTLIDVRRGPSVGETSGGNYSELVRSIANQSQGISYGENWLYIRKGSLWCLSSRPDASLIQLHTLSEHMWRRESSRLNVE